MSKLEKLVTKKFRAVTARVFIETPEGKVLFLKRASHKKHAGKWDLAGGSVDPGETPEQTAIREVREETGISLQSVEPVTSLKSKNKIRILFRAVVTNEETPVLDREHTDHKWAQKISGDEKMHPKTKKLIQKYERTLN